MALKAEIHKFFIFLFFSLIVLSPVNLFAHKVYIFAWAEDGMIYSESKFASNKPVQKGKISVYNQEEEIILTGATSDKGNFSFKIPEDITSDLTIEVNAGMGHLGKWKLGVGEIEAAYKGENRKEQALNEKAEKIKNPSFINISAGVFIIFIFFLLIAKLKKAKLKKND